MEVDQKSILVVPLLTVMPWTSHFTSLGTDFLISKNRVNNSPDLMVLLQAGRFLRAGTLFMYCRSSARMRFELGSLWT